MRPSRLLATLFFYAGLTFWTGTASAAPAPASHAPAVSVVDIGGLGNGPSAALAVSEGLAVGYAVTAGNNGKPNAVSSRGDALRDIGAGLYGSLAAAVNTAGVAVGQVFFGQQTQQRAVVFTGKREVDLALLPGDATSVATAINAHGVIVGTSTPATAEYVSQAFVYANGKVRGIPKLRALAGFVGANARGINDSGVIVGSVAQKSFVPATSSYVFDGKTLTLFATNHGFGNSQATAVNASGVVTGYHSTFSFSVNAPLHAYAYSAGTFVDLGTLYPADGFASSVAFAIDKRGLIVGYSQVSRGTLPPHATAFAGGSVTDLNTLLPAKSGWLLEVAEGIDDDGNIVGIGMHGSVQRGFILRTGASYAGLIRRGRL